MTNGIQHSQFRNSKYVNYMAGAKFHGIIEVNRGSK